MARSERRCPSYVIEYSTIAISLHRFNAEFDQIWREHRETYNFHSDPSIREGLKDWCFAEALYRITRMPIINHYRRDEGKVLMDEDVHELMIRAVERVIPRAINENKRELFLKVHCVGGTAFISIPTTPIPEWEIRRLRVNSV